MIKIITLVALLFPWPCNAQSSLIDFEAAGSIKASDFNSNFNHVKEGFHNKNTDILFSTYSSGELIDRERIEEDFNQVRDLGISVSPLNSSTVLAEELNKSFSDMIIGLSTYDDIPKSSNSSFSVNEDTMLVNSVTFSNVVGTSQVELLSPTTKGSLNLNSASGSFIYMPNLNFNGSDSFTFKVNDGKNSSSISTVSITVNPINDLAITAPQSLTTSEDVIINGVLSGTDVDEDALSFLLVSQGTKGVAVINSSTGAFSYTPNLNATGSDSFSYKVNDGKADSNISTISININPINDAPQASDLAFTTNEDTSFSSSLIATDVDSSSLTYSIVSQGTKGVVSITNASTGAFSYIPSLNQNGTDTFTFRVSDGSLFSNNATITMNITPVNDVPLANTQSIQSKEYTTTSGTLSGSDVDSANFTYLVDTQGSKGIFTITNASTGAFTYVPNVGAQGTDTFKFKVSDGALSSLPATVSVNIKPVDSSCDNIKARGLSSGYYDIDFDSFTSGEAPISLYCEFNIDTNVAWTQVARVNYQSNLWNAFSSDFNTGKTSDTETFGVKMQRFTQNAKGRDLEVMFKVDGQYRNLVYYDLNLNQVFNPTYSTGAITNIQQGIFYRSFGESSYTRCDSVITAHNTQWNWAISDSSGSNSCTGYNGKGGFILHGHANNTENASYLYGLNFYTGIAFSNVEVFVRKRTLPYPISCQHGNDNGIITTSGVTYNNIDIDSDGTPQNVACSVEGAKTWTLLINFGSAMEYNNASVLRNGLITNDAASTSNAGFSYNSTSWNHPDYLRSSAYVQFFLGGDSTGNVYIRAPKWGGEVVTRYWALNTSSTSSRFRISGDLGSVVHSSIVGNRSTTTYAPYIYRNSDVLWWEEYPSGVAGLDVIWIK